MTERRTPRGLACIAPRAEIGNIGQLVGPALELGFAGTSDHMMSKYLAQTLVLAASLSA